MAKRRVLSEAETLARNIAKVIRRSNCRPREIVEALMTVAAGRAVSGATHDDCVAFEQHAHAAFHSAQAVLTVPRKGPSLVN